MNPELLSFASIGQAIGQMFLITGIGYLLFERGLLPPGVVRIFSNLLIWVCFPALIFTRITGTFDPVRLPMWWVMPFLAMIMITSGFFLGKLTRLPWKTFTAKREYEAVSAFHNGGYFPITLIAFLKMGHYGDELLVYIFLFMMGFNLMFWSLLPRLLSRDSAREAGGLSILNLPVVAVVSAIASVYLLGTDWLPPFFKEPMTMLGDVCFPLSLLSLGAFLAEHRSYHSKHWAALLSCLGTKLVILPALVFVCLKFFPMSPTFRFILFLEAVMPTALTVALIGDQQKADNQFIGSMILYSHLAAFLTIPLWFILFSKIF